MFVLPSPSVLSAGLGTIAWAAYTLRRILRHLHFFQIEEYNPGRFAAFLGRNYPHLPNFREIGILAAMGAISFLAWPLLSELHTEVTIAFLLGWAVLYTSLFALYRPPESKKPLVLTARATRLLVTTCLLMFGCFLAVASSLGFYAHEPSSLWTFVLPAVVGVILAQLPGPFLVVANGVLFPVEELFRQYYIHSAHRVFMNHPDLKVIAVTGSYGKTSTKEIIAHLLSTRYHVLKTPRSFNTLMGICKVIREELKPQHEVFVVEMGTYKVGEIDKLCRLTPPHIGVITAVGPQHLERFKTVERVAEAKYELFRHLPAGGLGIFNADNPHCLALSRRPAGFRVVTYSTGANSTADLIASNVRLSGQGTEFDLTVDGVTAHVVTSLLGEHNVGNILAAVAVALELGLSLDEIVHAIATLAPVEHRLQYIRGAGGVIVIDDAYNSNPAGMQAALEILAAMPGKQKVLVTPGLVELGEREAQEHRRMGRLAAETCDYVILVGEKRTKDIAEGLREKNFPTERLLVVPGLKEATSQLQAIVRPGDVVLFENDLPDTYDGDNVYF